MKRRKILKLSSGALIALPACSSKKGAQAPAAGMQSGANPSGPQTQPVRLGANTQYRPPAYVNKGLRNPNMNLPSQFNGQTVTHSRGLSNQPYVAMTFDDGPHPQNTPRLLDILRTRNIKATFYVIGGNVDRYPHIVRRIVAEGHEIGNHTYTHRKLTSLGDSEVRKEMRRTEDAIVRAAAVRPRTMRPPYGALLQRQRSLIFSDFTYPTIMWSVDPNDWKRPGPSVVRSRILSGAHNGAIILAHDLHAPTIDAMPGTFDGLLSKGYQFITVSQLLSQKGQA
ncbi:polysaccharide deacetylase family protein [Akkermansiaceae bacterium]|nr:polysaccharide deacetylase family protein [Akkermansiaceae bacterium]MDB4526659.1 polysaccharide deacetylase family protein [bacterium]MDA9831327.1 polysaccharide deacetylase family protein [Akkermansiaceae bacterium]MDB4488647.1 polysaccharide deacetylase family protein [Akkermansiaceae bacterium]MDB4502060.1 polysaccharide deacetylase family protein [Akkermansiaceae bacterium]